MQKLVAGVLLVIFILSTLAAYPKAWNDAMKGMDAKTGFHLPYLPDTSYKLGLDLSGGAHLVYEADMSAIPNADRSDALSGVRDVVERRVNAFGVSEPIVQTNVTGGKYRIIVDLPGITNVDEAVKQIGETPVLEFKVPDPDVSVDPTPEQLAQIEAAQKTERAAAVAILDRALDKEDFAALAKENSIDAATKDNGGYLGFVSADDEEYGGFIDTLIAKRYRTGVINGLYEGTSRIHIMKYLSSKVENEPEAYHLLACYKGATNCTAERSKEEARALAETWKSEVNTDIFSEYAVTHNDDTAAAQARGRIGTIARGMTIPAFEDAVYAMKDGTISDIVETEFGFHIIYRASSTKKTYYELAHIEMPWTTASDVVVADPWKNTELSGKHIKRATVAFDPNSGAPYIVLDFNAEGAELFGKLTAENVGKVIGIFLDGQPVTIPTVQEAIYGGQATITGSDNLNEAKLTAQRLNAGALPVPISVVSQQTIGPALGEVSLQKSVAAGLVGFLLVALFMIAYYRLPGLLAALALLFYAAVNLALYKVFGVTMTLSGIAGFVFSFGIAVDANVLIFERLKEELQSGKDLPSATEEAFHRAWPSIRDGNITTLIATTVLYFMSSGFIRGFALTLTIGVLVSMFSAMIVTHTLMRFVVRIKAFRKPIFYRGMTK
jgi:protein-export membrane protein SecD